MDVELYGPLGNRIGQKSWSKVSFTAGTTRTVRWTWYASSVRRLGTYTVKIGIFRPGWGRLLSWNNRATTVRVVR